MSNKLSPAQTLPVDVIRLILKWVAEKRRSSINGANNKLANLKELLTVCSIWRQVSLEYLWQTIRLTINRRTHQVTLNHQVWADEQIPPYAEKLVKVINLNVPMPFVVSGVAYELLADYFGDTKCFSSAHTFNVHIDDSMNHHADDKEAVIANVLEFAKLLKSIVPGATTVNIINTSEKFSGPHGSINPVGEFYGEILKTLGSVLYANTQRAYLDLSQVDINNVSTFHSIPPLTSLNLDYTASSDVYGCLMHKSASTLESLVIPIHSANMLLFDLNGETVVYPNLQELMLPSYFKDTSNIRVKASTATPFPVLRKMYMDSSYPFDDDLPFRGNSATLRSLDICLNHGTIAMLSHKRVFESNNKVLRNVNITMYDSNRDANRNSQVDIDKFFNDLVSAATSLTVSDYRIGMDCLTAAQHGHAFQNIKMLVVRSRNMSLFQIFSVLKALPALVSIGVGLGDLGPEFENIFANELPDHVASTYHDVGKNLLVWRMVFYDGRRGFPHVDCLLLLALACPNLRRLEMMYNTVKNYRSKVATALESGPYSKYASQLSRLLDITYDGSSDDQYN